jgi:glycosyltransferase involved in cell wall biosynthesis
MTKILIISGDIVDVHMGGVGVRNWELARALSRFFNISLAVPNPIDLQSSDVKVISFDLENDDLRPLAKGMDVIILHGFVLHFHPYLCDLGIPLAVDLYVPSLLESLVWHDQDEWASWIPAYEEYARVQCDLIRAGDFFFCASERQRDYWLGWLHSLNRINPHTYRQDPSLRKLLDVVPFGLPDGIPQATYPVLKGVKPGLSKSDKLIIWSGGLWDWLDPLTLIRAMARLETQHPDLKLYFLGTRHPNPLLSGMKMPSRAILLSQELGLLNKSIFFGDWTPYEQRGLYLAEADIAVIAHPAHIETHFSYRTRVLDCIWAGKPLIITEGDSMAELVEEYGIGFSVPPADEEAMAAALEKLLMELDTNQFAPAFDCLREQYRWDRVILPLKSFCQDPTLAPDKGMYLTNVEKMSRDKDLYLQAVVKDWQSEVKERDAVIERYQRLLPVRIYRMLKGIFR